MTTLYRCLLTACLASCASLAFAAEAPLNHISVFVSGQDGYHTFRIPAVEVAPDGSLLIVAEARKYTSEDPGYGDQEIDLVYKRSTDQGATWSPMVVMEHAGTFWASANPATVVDRSNGKIWVFYVRAKPHRSSDTARPGTDDMRNLARWSADNGKTWSEPVDLTPVARDMKDPAWKVSVPGPGGVIQTRSGRIILAMWRMPFSCFALFSDDHGATWHRGQLVPGTQGGDECKVVELADGRILFNMRQETGPTSYLAESADGGMTWTNLRPGPKVSPVACGFKYLAMGDHGHVLWTGPESSKRKHLAFRCSDDEGKTFKYRRLISDDFAAYSDIALLPGHTVGVVWERGLKKNYELISFTRLDRAWLDAVSPANSGP